MNFVNPGEPANFLDVGGGVTAENAVEAFRIILSDSGVKAELPAIRVAAGLTEAAKMVVELAK